MIWIVSTYSMMQKKTWKELEKKNHSEKQQGDLFLDSNAKDNIETRSQSNNNPIIDYLDFEDGYEKVRLLFFQMSDCIY